MPPEINYEKCSGCGNCVKFCAEDVFFGTKGFGQSKKEKPVVTYPDLCWHCHACVLECPVEGAIRVRTPLAMSVVYK